VTSPDLFRSTH